jgi:hypothetical protein
MGGTIMAKTNPLTHAEFSAGLSEARIGAALETVYELRHKTAETQIARIAELDATPGREIAAYAVREGRGRELTLYLFEAAAREMRAQRLTGKRAGFYLSLNAREAEDQTLADSLRLVADRLGLMPEACGIIVPLEAYFANSQGVLPALLRLRTAGFGVAVQIDAVAAPRFRPLAELPLSGFCLGGHATWRRLRTIGPGKLGALGAWIGWAESEGLRRLAFDLQDARADETARLYGFTYGAGPHLDALSAAPAETVTSIKRGIS